MNATHYAGVGCGPPARCSNRPLYSLSSIPNPAYRSRYETSCPCLAAINSNVRAAQAQIGPSLPLRPLGPSLAARESRYLTHKPVGTPKPRRPAAWQSPHGSEEFSSRLGSAGVAQFQEAGPNSGILPLGARLKRS